MGGTLSEKISFLKDPQCQDFRHFRVVGIWQVPKAKRNWQMAVRVQPYGKIGSASSPSFSKRLITSRNTCLKGNSQFTERQEALQLALKKELLCGDGDRDCLAFS